MAILRSLFGPTPGELQGPVSWLHESAQGGRRTSAGVDINPDNAMTLSSVFAAVRAVAEDVAKLPFGLFEQEGTSHVYPMLDDPLHKLVAVSPNPEMTSFDMRQAVVANGLMWHGGYAEIERNGMGDAVALWPYHPRRVIPRKDDADNIYYQILENLHTIRGEAREIPARDMIHVKGFNTTGLVGYIISHFASESFGIAKAAEQFSATFFGNGATTSGIVSFDGQMTPEIANETRRRITEKHAGPDNAWSPILLDHGAKFQPTSVDAEKSQLNETLQFRVEDIARWFRIPPHKLQHLARATFSNIEHQAIEYVGDTILPWLVRVEQEFRRKLIPEDTGRRFFRHDVDSLIQADMKTRFESYAIAVNNGFWNRNEARSKEGMNPIPSGDKYVIQQNLATVEEDGSITPNNRDSGSGGAQQGQGPQAPQAMDVDRAKVVAMPVFVDAAERVVTVEAKALTAKKEPTREWLDQWYARHRENVKAAVEPPIAMLGRMLDAETDGIADRYADAHVGESRRELEKSGDWQETTERWAAERPAWIARHLTDEVANNAGA